ncbi:MAG: hypothetical protein NTX22_17960 [Ignavibacteriales bacterium]|nr:hypothetical protein [Ignavibacteriales bacterium]
MPLKKPKGIPKLPKTRKKNIEAAKDAIPQKKENKVEYLCFAFFKFDSVFNKQFCTLRIITVAEFTHFAYELSVASSIHKNVIEITLLGLQAKINYLPKVEPAKVDIDFENLYGEYTVNIIKQDGSINSAVFNFNIFKKDIKLTKKFLPEKKNNRLFCDFIVSQNDFTFREE